MLYDIVNVVLFLIFPCLASIVSETSKSTGISFDTCVIMRIKAVLACYTIQINLKCCCKFGQYLLLQLLSEIYESSLWSLNSLSRLPQAESLFLEATQVRVVPELRPDGYLIKPYNSHSYLVRL